jgi:FixJ family two-component response regulator
MRGRIDGPQWTEVKNRRLKDPMAHQPPGFIVAVVDDDEAILRSLEILLESADYAVRLFHSGAELLDRGSLREIDCLISDIDMPGMDGFELLRLVHSARPGLPIILITGYPDTLKRLPPLGRSNPRFFTKPFDGSELLAAVVDALRKPQE